VRLAGQIGCLVSTWQRRCAGMVVATECDRQWRPGRWGPAELRRCHDAVRHLLTGLLIATAAIATGHAARAESSTIGVTFTSNREPDKFADPKSIKYELNGTHTYDNGLFLTGLFQYSDTAFSAKTSQNLEGAIGSTILANAAVSIWGSAGLGEHWRQNPSTAFPYYVFRVGADVDLSKTLTWNVVSFRYRDAFDPNDNYNTPQVATGFTYKLEEQSTITAKVMRNWKDGAPSSTAISLGFKQKF
jgi:hypothetical protein